MIKIETTVTKIETSITKIEMDIKILNRQKIESLIRKKTTPIVILP